MKYILVIWMAVLSTLSLADQAWQFLIKPSGPYAVSMKKYPWSNTSSCPDNYYQQIHEAFYNNRHNPNRCHMLDVYVYYPTTSKSQEHIVYDSNTILEVQHDLNSNHIKDLAERATAKNYLDALAQRKSYIVANQSIASGKFPLIVFLPGFSFNSNDYQNYIVNLVSHGYIVAAIDSAYSSTLHEEFGNLDRNKIQFAADGSPSISFMLDLFGKHHSNLSSMKSDLNLVLTKLTTLDPFNQHIDFRQIGGLGHSLGAIAIYENSFKDNNKIKAFISLDFGQSRNKPKHIYAPKIPSLIFQAANDKQYGEKMQTSAEYILAKGSYLVRMSPSLANLNYSKHSGFSDFSTSIQDKYLWDLRIQTYSEIKEPWYNSGKTYASALDSLGTGDGREFSMNVNEYIVSFFNAQLKAKANPNFNNCKALTTNTQLFCGPLDIS